MKTRVGIAYNAKKNVASLGSGNEASNHNPETVAAMKNALEHGGYDVALLEVMEDLPSTLAQGDLDIVFNIAEGISGRGKEMQVPAILNYFDIPYTGSDETAMHIAMDKALAKSLLSTYQIDTPYFNIVDEDMTSSRNSLSFPAIAKPISEGSGRGITDSSVVSNYTELNTVLSDNITVYKQKMLVEEYIEGREFTVGILGNADDILVFTPMEIVFKNSEDSLYSYDVKNNYDKYVDYVCPPNLSIDMQEKIKATAKKIYKIIGCRDYARIDFRLAEDGRVYFLEANPLPGLVPGYSDLPMIAGFCGVDYDTLICRILETAQIRYGLI